MQTGTKGEKNSHGKKKSRGDKLRKKGEGGGRRGFSALPKVKWRTASLVVADFSRLQIIWSIMFCFLIIVISWPFSLTHMILEHSDKKRTKCWLNIWGKTFTNLSQKHWTQAAAQLMQIHTATKDAAARTWQQLAPLLAYVFKVDTVCYHCQTLTAYKTDTKSEKSLVAVCLNKMWIITSDCHTQIIMKQLSFKKNPLSQNRVRVASAKHDDVNKQSSCYSITISSCVSQIISLDEKRRNRLSKFVTLISSSAASIFQAFPSWSMFCIWLHL